MAANTRRRHVVVLNQFALPLSQGGGTRHTELFSRLDGWSHTIIAGERNHYSQEKFTTDDPAFQLVKVPSQKGGGAARLAGWLAYSAQAFWRTVREPRVDVVYASTPHPLAPLAGWAAAKVKRAPFVLEVRDLWPESIVSAGKLKEGSAVHRILSAVERFPVRRAESVVGVTQGWEEHFAQLGAKKLVVVPNGSVFRDDLPTLSDQELSELRPDVPGPFGVFAGAHGAMNGLDLILDAAVRHPQVGFTLIGSGPAKAAAVRRAEREGLRNVLFHAPIPKSEVARVLASFDFGIHSILSLDVLDKGMSPNKLFDYMACDLPVVSNAGAGLRRFDVDGGIGALGSDLGDAVQELLDAGAEQRQGWAANRRRLMTGPFSREQSARDLGSVLEGAHQARSRRKGRRGKAPRVVHVSSAHGPTDNRILRKECRALADAGYDVHLVTRGPRQEIVPSVTHHPISSIPGSRLGRMLVGPLKALRIALGLKPALIHLHDPELIPLGLLVDTFTRVKVVFDAHEDLPAQVMGKHYLPAPVRPLVARFAGLLGNLAGRGLSGIIAATPAVARAFPPTKTEIVKNFPWEEDYREAPERTASNSGPFTFGYVGGMSRIRGIDEMIQATEGYRLLLAGPADEYATAAIEKAGDHVEYVGVVSAGEVPNLLQQIDAGLVLLHDVPNYRESIPTKLLEYMASGVPFVASDFHAWRELTFGLDVGEFVDISDSDALRDTVVRVALDRSGTVAKGAHARAVFLDSLTFDQEVAALVSRYESMLL